MASLKIKTRVRDREFRQEALLRAASKLFASKGFETTTTREIAAEAGCAEGLIHRYFASKQGLLLAILKQRASQQVLDLIDISRTTASIEDELLFLVDCELDRACADREFLKVVVRQAMVDASFAEVITQISLTERSKVLGDRLKRFAECRELAKDELEAVTHFVITSGFMFGFMRPVVLRQDRSQTRAMALTMAKLLGSSLSAHSFSLDTFQSLPSLR